MPARTRGVTGMYTTTGRILCAKGRFSILRTCNVWIGRPAACGGLCCFGALDGALPLSRQPVLINLPKRSR